MDGINKAYLLIAAAAVAYLLLKKNAIASVAAGAVNAAGQVATGTVLGVGDALGVPRTNQTQCQQDIAAGKTWDASFSCPAGDFLSYLTSSQPSPSIAASPAQFVPAPAGASQSDAATGLNFDYMQM
ncbi:hypothetical protein CAter10_2507 [Collimonas arenae]|uniref:hypothetical protein n=1 Tax=Collimonas arenae TaxID=279058 RepID=UPI000778750A|nr:hypothetical protein [Collimonas arenae]AMP00153.1 hypothetical protein CAter10_2507 [Collimonas arenae]